MKNFKDYITESLDSDEDIIAKLNKLTLPVKVTFGKYDGVIRFSSIMSKTDNEDEIYNKIKSSLKNSKYKFNIKTEKISSEGEKLYLNHGIIFS